MRSTLLFILVIIGLVTLAQTNGVFERNPTTRVLLHTLSAKLDHDDRPVKTVLFLGNSRTFYNDMPSMLPKIANSAHSPVRYDVTMYARPGYTLNDHWNDANSQSLIAQKWDYVVIQDASAEQINDTMIDSFEQYGEQLVNAVKAHGSKPVLFVGWRCADDYYPQIKDIGREKFYEQIQTAHDRLALVTGVDKVNVGRAWEPLLNQSNIPMTVDGNHPTMQGSYFTMLLFYHYFSGDSTTRVTYVPAGISPEDAQALRSMAAAQ